MTELKFAVGVAYCRGLQSQHQLAYRHGGVVFHPRLFLLLLLLLLDVALMQDTLPNDLHEDGCFIVS
jgi:hypothetical protein